MWRKPVGLGAMRTFTDITALYRRQPWNSARTSRPRGGIDTAIDRIVAIGGDCVQVFTQSPRMWRPTNHSAEAIEAFRAKRAEHGIGGVVCHALYLANLAAPDRTIHKKSIAALQATVDAGNAIEADGVIFHVGSHLGAGLRAALTRTTRALAQILEHCERRHVAPDRELGRHG